MCSNRALSRYDVCSFTFQDSIEFHIRSYTTIVVRYSHGVVHVRVRMLAIVVATTANESYVGIRNEIEISFNVDDL